MFANYSLLVIFLMALSCLKCCSSSIKELDPSLSNLTKFEMDEAMNIVRKGDVLVLNLFKTLNKRIELLDALIKSANCFKDFVRDRKTRNAHKTSYNIVDLKCQNDRLPQNCHQVQQCQDHLYSIKIPSYSNKSLIVACDMKTENGGWTIIQRRQDGSVDFYRNWTEYVNGFGDLNGEFFIGLEKLHILTTQGKPQELYIILEDFEGKRRNALYKTFKVGPQDTNFQLTIGNYSGDAGDSFDYSNKQKFTTWDRDNDAEVSENCAKNFKSAWWFKRCHECHLNGEYLFGKLSETEKGEGINWSSFRGKQYSLKFVQLMVRPRGE